MVFQRIKYYFYYIRPLAFLGILLVFEVHSLIAVRLLGLDLFNLLLFNKIFPAISIAFLAVAANALNNILDFEIDKINKPNRILVQNKITLKEAWCITILLYSLSLILSFWSGILFFIFYFLFFILTIFYSARPLRFKGHWLSAGFTLALLRGFLLVVSAWSLWTLSFNIVPFYIGLILFVIVFGASMAKDISDVHGDRMHGVKTIVVVYGFGVVRCTISLAVFISFAMFFLGVFFGILNKLFLFSILLLPYVIYNIYILYFSDNEIKTAEGNHASWKHIYILYMVYNFIFLLFFVL